MNILLTSVGRRTYLIDYFKEVVGKTGKVHASNSIYTYSLSHADCYVLTPQIYNSGYIDFLIEYCKAHNIKAILSLFDIDLPVLSANKGRFAEIGVTVIVSDNEAVKICNDKWLTYKFLCDNNIKTPKTYHTLQEAKKAISKGDIVYPVIMKPRWGMGSIGIYRVENEEELDILYLKLQREIFRTYLRFESHEAENECIIIQEMVTGEEYGLDVLNDLSSKYVTTVAKKKIAMRAGETDVAEIVSPEAFLTIGKKLSESLKHIANLDVDCFLDDNNNIYVLELNCRFGGQYPFSHLAGVDFPKQIVEWLEGKPSNSKFYTPTIGTISCKDLVPVKM